jgi:hypothetical protein
LIPPLDSEKRLGGRPPLETAAPVAGDAPPPAAGLIPLVEVVGLTPLVEVVGLTPLVGAEKLVEEAPLGSAAGGSRTEVEKQLERSTRPQRVHQA